MQITCNTSRALHVQHVVCHVVRRDRSPVQSDRVEIAFILALFYWLKPSTDEGREETGVPGENPRRRASDSFSACDRLPTVYILTLRLWVSLICISTQQTVEGRGALQHRYSTEATVQHVLQSPDGVLQIYPRVVRLAWSLGRGPSSD